MLDDLFADDMTLLVENPKVSTKTQQQKNPPPLPTTKILLELKNELSSYRR
jgi:hypothetical protein